MVSYSQIPSDNEVWQDRCLLLSSMEGKIAAGQTPARLVKATRGVPGTDFYTLAFDRGQAANHYVACTLYYLSAIADRTGNGGKADPQASATAAMLARDELKYARHQNLTFYERLQVDEVKWHQFGHTLTLSADQTQAVVIAGSTMPISLEPDPDVGMYRALR